MQYRKLGHSGLIVSALGLGSMQFGRAMNMGRLDQPATSRLVRSALDRGVNLIDTADVYSRGESESLLGVALEGVRDRVVLATKVRLPMSDDDVNRSGAHRVNIVRGIEESLRRLRTDHVDLYQLHGWDSNTPLEETLRAMDDVVRQGKVRYIGLSNYLAWLPSEDLQALNDVSDPGVPYPKWMVLQLDQAEDPRPRILNPDAFSHGGPWQDLRGRRSE
jgi:aryl-alcohol dehydrogenase-like predicted oxidoreductase